MTTALIAEIDVDAPIAEVYRQWTRLESYPEYLEAIRSVRRIDDIRSRWSASVGGIVVEFYADIVEQVLDESISWQSTDGVLHDGQVDLRPTTRGTRVRLRMAWDAGGVEASGVGEEPEQASRDLERFKEIVEQREAPGGA